MRGAIAGPRLLLRRLREVMAEPVSAQERLDKIVVLIAGNMVAEVCSVYVLRIDGMLELYATEGLKREAVHQTVLRQDEGLVGLVSETAEAVNLSDAPADPHFSYRPETGEDPFKAFLGVPIVRGGQVFGVLTVQNKAERIYAEEEVEALQTTAMVLAEMIAVGELAGLHQTFDNHAVERRSHGAALELFFRPPVLELGHAPIIARFLEFRFRQLEGRLGLVALFRRNEILLLQLHVAIGFDLRVIDAALA